MFGQANHAIAAPATANAWRMSGALGLTRLRADVAGGAGTLLRRDESTSVSASMNSSALG